MLPDVGAGPPLSAIWLLAAIILLGFTVSGGALVVMFGRALKKRDESDAGRDDRMNGLDHHIRMLKVELLESEKTHLERVHDLHAQVLQCRAEQCSIQGRFISAADHHGDVLRLEGAMEMKFSEVMAAIVGIHKRIDVMLNQKAQIGGDGR